jgi:VWFA-related protein
MHEHICGGNARQAFEGAQAFIDQLEPRDRVAVITMPQGRVEVDLTTDHARAKERLGKIVGHSQQSSGNQTTSESRALFNFVTGLAALDGAKTIVLISEGLNANEGNVFTPQDLSAVAAPTAGAPGFETVQAASATIGETNGLRGAAAAARAQFYVIRPNTVGLGCTGMPTPASRPTDVLKQEALDQRLNEQLISQESALATVASVTGGHYFSLSGRATAVFDRILRETSAYYTIAFEADPQDLAGRLGKIEVRTTRPGLGVRVRVANPTPKPVAPSTSASVRDMAVNAGTYRELPLWLAAFPVRGTKGEFKTPIVVDSLERAWQEAAFTLSDSKGKLISAWRADLPAPAGPIVTAQSLPSGHYRLRAAVIDQSGKRGNVDYEFDAKLEEAGPLKLGTMMVGTVADGKFQPRLVSAAGSSVTGYFEIYGTAGSVSVAFTLTKSNEAAPLVDAAGDVTPTRDADRRLATASLPLGDLPAGDYVVRGTVSVGGQQVGTVASALHVVAK